MGVCLEGVFISGNVQRKGLLLKDIKSKGIRRKKMIIDIGDVKVYPSGPGMKWKKGVLPLSKKVMDALNWENQVVGFILFNFDEIPDPEYVIKRINEFKKVVELEKKVLQMKDELRCEDEKTSKNIGNDTKIS